MLTFSRMSTEKLSTSYRLTERAIALLELLSRHEGIGRGDVIETLIRRRAAELNLEVPAGTPAEESAT